MGHTLSLSEVDLMKIVIITDAWPPMVCGVITTLLNTARCLESLGHEVAIIHHGDFRSLPFPGEKGLNLVMDSMEDRQEDRGPGT